MSDSLRFKRAVVFVYVVQKVEGRRDHLSNESLPWLEGGGFPSFFFSGARRRTKISKRIRMLDDVYLPHCMARLGRFLQGHWTFLGPGSEEKWNGDSHENKGQWNCTANKMVQRLNETGHPIIESTSALSRGILKQRRGRWEHFKYESRKYQKGARK